MAEHPNVERTRRGYDAFANGDLNTLRDLFDANIRWHVAGTSPLSGDYNGIDEVFGFFGRILDETQGSLKQEVHDILGNDEHVVALVRVTAERNGKRLDQKAAHIAHTNDEGRITEFWVFSEDTTVADEFWS